MVVNLADLKDYMEVETVFVLVAKSGVKVSHVAGTGGCWTVGHDTRYGSNVGEGG